MEIRHRYSEPPSLEKFSSGSFMTDLVVGGGFPVGRVINIVGNYSSGKSLNVIETCASFANAYPEGIIRYVETEHAFDPEYASKIGLPLERVQLEDTISVIEDVQKDYENFLKGDPKVHKLYILDSLDALSDNDELERDIAKGSYNLRKQKILSEMFRRSVAKTHQSLCTFIIVSQTRENIGVSMGDKQRRSGGKSLDFYSSIILWMDRVSNIKKIVKGVDRTTGIITKIRTKKNKVSAPFKEGLLYINFSYGTDDEISCLEWMIKILKKKTVFLSGKDFPISSLKSAIKKARNEKKFSLLKKLRHDIFQETQRLWDEIEEGFKINMTKNDVINAEMEPDLSNLKVNSKEEESDSEDSFEE